jgi:hypothetical protein
LVCCGDRVVEPAAGEVHNPPLTDGRIMLLLGSHFRRERGDFVKIGARKAARPAPDRTRT